jgi:FkbM family methyltransferase
MTRWSAITRTHGRRSALAYGSRSMTAAATTLTVSYTTSGNATVRKPSVVNPRRLLFVEHHPVFGGPHNRAIVLSGPLRERGWETIALLPDVPGTAAERFRRSGIPVEAIRLHRFRRSIGDNAMMLAQFAFDVSRLRAAIRKHDIDLVVVAGFESPHGVIAGRLEGVPVVWQIISSSTPIPYCRAMSPFARRFADVVMTTGTTVAAQAGVHQLGERWVPFFSPVDTDHFRPSLERRAAARWELGLPQDALVVGTVGNVNPHKGHPMFVEAASRVRQSLPDVRFLILGEQDSNHAEFRRALEEDANALGLRVGDDILIRSPGTRVAQLAAAIDVFWFTSVPRSEGVPTAVMEAMALALPVVATDVGGIREILHHEKTGVLVRAFASDMLADVTIPLLADTARRAEVGAAARGFAVDHCTIEQCLSTHLRAFETALLHSKRRIRARRSAADRGERRSGIDTESNGSVDVSVEALLPNAPARPSSLRRVRKVAKLIRVSDYRNALRFRVAAAIEHERVPFRQEFLTIVDVGAHHGQFAVFAARRFRRARLICIEPLPAAQAKLRRVLPGSAKVIGVAAAETSSVREFHVSRATDSSSLLPISSECVAAFPGTEEEAVVLVPTARLDELLTVDDLIRPVLLKLDVQGAELQALQGSTRILEQVDEILVECSFVELYTGQALASTVVDFVKSQGFGLTGMFSVVQGADGRCLQADLHFLRST